MRRNLYGGVRPAKEVISPYIDVLDGSLDNPSIRAVAEEEEDQEE